MKELTDSAAINDAVYEMNLNGSYPLVKLEVITVDAKEIKDKGERVFRDPKLSIPLIDHYHFTYPGKDEKVLYNQTSDAHGDDVPVYSAGKAVEEDQFIHFPIDTGESRIITARKVIARGPVWVWVAIAIGLPKEGSSDPYLVVEAADTFGAASNTESDMIGFIKGKQREMTARLIRRAHLRQLTLSVIRTEYKYVFVEPEQVGKAKIKEG